MSQTPSRPDDARAPPDAGALLLRLAAEMAGESHPRRPPRVTLDSRLDADLGLDSLGRVELLLRVERAFGRSLPDQALLEAQTVRDLLRFVQAGAEPGAAAVEKGVRGVAPEEAAEAPERAATLVEALDWHAAAHPGRAHVLLLGEGGGEEEIGYAALREGAARIAAGLLGRGLERGERVALMLPTGRDYLFSFFGVMLAGGVPVPLYPPLRPAQLEEHLRRHAGILSNAQAAFLVAAPEARAPARRLRAQAATLREVLAPAELEGGGGPLPPPPGPEDVAFLQYTSGSTGDPKGVVLTHANLLANVRALGEAAQASSRDVFVSWLPLYHDMGLIGAWLGSLYYGCPLVLMPTLAFLTRPQRWLWAIHRYRGTVSAAPNFAYDLCARSLGERHLEGLDLSCWRLAINAAEPVSPQTLEAFSRRFAARGLRAEALTPAYGLAECSAGLCMPPPGRGPAVDRVRREPFTGLGRAVPADAGDASALSFAGCGAPLPGHHVRIVDAAGFEVGERQEGRLLFKGPSATSGYFRKPETTRDLFHGEWLDTGDLGYLAGGEVFVTGRVKEVVIRGGRNVYPYELEEAVGALPAARRGSVAVFGSRDPRGGTERLVVMAETRASAPEERDELRRRVNELAVDLVGMPADDVMLVPPHAVLKTSSGKIRRAACRELYERGGPGAGAARREKARALGRMLAGRLRRGARDAGELLFAARAWSAAALVAAAGWPLAALLARPAWCWRFSRAAGRALLRLAGVRVVVSGLENLPRGRPFVLAVNHSSYLDGLVLLTALERPFGFVAKRELLDSRLARVYLKRLGAEFVERFDAPRGVEDAARLERALERGKSLIFFPEGTFAREAGLMPFRMGAFAAAARAGAPVVPAAIRGTRSMLRGGSWFPRRGPVSVSFGAPVAPSGRGWPAAVKLRDEVRADILRRCGEPDRERAS